MHISFSPARSDDRLTLSRSGDSLTINGDTFNFGQLSDGELLPLGSIDSGWFAGPVRRVSGKLYITILLPHGPDAPEQTRFPAPVDVTDDGPISVPPYQV